MAHPLRIAVVGGGPAGSFFTLWALHYAAQAGRAVEVELFEPRDFSRPGAPGCNMCAGIIPGGVPRELRALDLPVPSGLLVGELGAYVLHTGAGSLRVTMADPEAHVAAVFRGNGPGPGSPPGPLSFDGFLLAEAERRGARVVRERVVEISARPLRWVRTPSDLYMTDLLVLATGVNGGGVEIRGTPYVPPPTESMAQGEVLVGEAEVRGRLGSAIHVFLPRTAPVLFGTLVPKGAFVSVCLLGRGLGRRAIGEFLALDEVRELLPEGSRQVCGCRPRIAVGPGRPLFDDGFVAVGDAGVTRLYKNGVGTALATARQAAETAIRHGVGAEAFRRHYAPLCRRIQRDNRYGRVLFAVAGVLLRRFLTAPGAILVAGERGDASGAQAQGRILWGLLTGSDPYEVIFRMLLGLVLRPGRPASPCRRQPTGAG